MRFCHYAFQLLNALGFIVALGVALMGVGPVDQMIVMRQLCFHEVLHVLSVVNGLAMSSFLLAYQGGGSAYGHWPRQEASCVWHTMDWPGMTWHEVDWNGNRPTEEADLDELLRCLSTLIYVHCRCAYCSSACSAYQNCSLDAMLLAWQDRASLVAQNSGSIRQEASSPKSVILWCHKDESLARSRAFLPSSSSAASAEKNLGPLQCHPACLLYAEQACSACLLTAHCSLQLL